MLKDLALKKNKDGIYDISFENGDFSLDSGLKTAILTSIFTEKRDEEATDWENKGGWVGNQLSDNEFEIGSLVWTLFRSSTNSETESSLEDYILDSLQWLLDNNFAKSLEVSINKNLDNSSYSAMIQIINNDNVEENLAFDLFENTV